MPPKERQSMPGGVDCAVHGERIDRLEDGQAEILAALNGTLQTPGLLSQLALLRQSVDDLRRELKEERKGRAMPTRAQVLTVILAALLAVGGAWVGTRLPGAPTAQTQASHTH